MVFSRLQTKEQSQEPVKTEGPVIVYTDTGFSPSPLEIKVGATVVFKNESAKVVWPASALHPSHNEYPQKGGCIGSAFDACKDLKFGESWSFQFDFSGAWRYHNHRNPSHFGQIIVK